VLGVGAGLLTGWYPADRIVTFGFVVPILAALGLVRVARWLEPRRGRGVAVAVAVALTLAVLAGALIAWNRQEPFLSEEEVHAATLANAMIARTEPGTPLAFLVYEPDATVSFLATRAGNVIRAAVPPDRIRDVVVVVPPIEGGGAERRALERLTAADLRRAEEAAGRPAATFVVRAIDRGDAPDDAIVVVSPAILVRPPAIGGQPLEPASPGAIAISSLLALALVTIVGYGWARVAAIDPRTAAALAPATGAGALVLAGIAIERLGVPIDAAGGAWAVSALAGGGGYVVWRVLERRAAARPAPQVQE
jgi:hypothetical protein